MGLVNAFESSPARGRTFLVTLPPPAPLPRFELTSPSWTSTEVEVDDAAPTRPWVPDAPTRPDTPPLAWAAHSVGRASHPGVPARNVSTVRPPPPADLPSRLPAALHGFAAGLACGAICLVILRGGEPPVEDVVSASAAGGNAAGIAAAPVPAPVVTVPPTSFVVAAPLVRAEDLPRAAVRVEDLPTPPTRRGSRWHPRH
jgi:hypothetical protein